MRPVSPLLLLLLAMAALAGCAAGPSGLRGAPDGGYVVSISSSRVVPALVEPIDEALAEARFKCWSDQKGLAVLSRRMEPAAGIGLSRKATVHFRCDGERGTSSG